MVRSMTAYGRAIKKSPEGRWVVELHSVNRKMLDLNVAMAKELLRFDLDVRKQIGEQVVRGQVTARITYERDEAFSPASVKGLSDAKKRWEGIAKKLGYDAK